MQTNNPSHHQAVVALHTGNENFVRPSVGGWDHHTNMRSSFESRATATDKPIPGLLADLKQRNLLRETLAVWGGEFGRQANPDNNGGRGHNNKGFTMWMAGGGVKGGFRYGETDPLGREAVAGKLGRRPRSARDHPASSGARSRAADIPLLGQGLSPHRRGRSCRQGHSRLI